MKNKKFKLSKTTTIILSIVFVVIVTIALFFNYIINLPTGNEAIKNMNEQEKIFLEKVMNNLSQNTSIEDLTDSLGPLYEYRNLGTIEAISWKYPIVPSGEVRFYYYNGQLVRARWMTFKFVYEINFEP